MDLMWISCGSHADLVVDNGSVMIDTSHLSPRGPVLQAIDTLASEHIEAHMAKEFSDENLAFWRAARDFPNHPEAERRKLVHSVMREFIEPDSEREVNIPSGLVDGADL